jgi:squalene synthase HpnC
MAESGAGLNAPVAAEAQSVLSAIAAASLGQHGSENFPVALRVVPRRPRGHLLRIYTFARFVDDVGDEAPGNRLALLDMIEEDVRTLSTGRPKLAPVAGLGPVVRDCGLPLEPLLDLIEANRMDQRVSRYRTFDDLLAYCRLSAAPIGRMVLSVAGVTGADEVAMSDSITAGLQVLEHCQDVGEDAHAGRVYLPAEDLQAAGATDADLLDATTSPQVRRVIALQVDRARAMLQDGRPLIRQLHGWSRLAVSGYLAGGLATAAALRCGGHDVLATQIRPSKARMIGEAARLVVGR